jgi:hypothetical protein
MGIIPILVFEQVLLLELDDGPKIYQGTAIHKYCATHAGFAPKDLIQIYRG